MSNPIQTIPSAVGVFQAHFGAPPGGQDPKADCEKWERLCSELIADRERLRAELEKARLEQICSEWGPIGTMEEVYANIDRSTTLEQIVADLAREAEAEK